MDINELREKRRDLELKLGGLIREFERETDCEVNNFRYDAWYVADNEEETPITPILRFDVEIGAPLEDEDGNSEELPEADAATA